MLCLLQKQRYVERFKDARRLVAKVCLTKRRPFGRFLWPITVPIITVDREWLYNYRTYGFMVDLYSGNDTDKFTVDDLLHRKSSL